MGRTVHYGFPVGALTASKRIGLSLAAAGIVVATILISPPAMADDPFSLFMSACERIPTATPQLCKETWDMVQSNKCRSTVVEYLDHRGVAFGDDRQMFNSAMQIQRGSVPLDVC